MFLAKYAKYAKKKYFSSQPWFFNHRYINYKGHFDYQDPTAPRLPHQKSFEPHCLSLTPSLRLFVSLSPRLLSPALLHISHQMLNIFTLGHHFHHFAGFGKLFQ
jgi:hypothetical protein